MEQSREFKKNTPEVSSHLTHLPVGFILILAKLFILTYTYMFCLFVVVCLIFLFRNLFIFVFLFLLIFYLVFFT